MALFADIMNSYMRNEGQSTFGTGRNEMGPPEQKAATRPEAQPDQAYVTGGTDYAGRNLTSMYTDSAGIQTPQMSKADPLPANDYVNRNPAIQGSGQGLISMMAMASSKDLKAGIVPHGKARGGRAQAGKFALQDSIGKLMFEVQELGKEIHALKSRRK